MGFATLKKLSPQIGLALIITALLIVFFLASIHSIRVDFGATDTFLLWQGLKQYGYSFLEHWHYAQENGLLSILPIHALLFAFFPFNSWLLILSGTFLWLSNVILAAMISYQLRAKQAAILAPLLLLCAGKFVYEQGYLVYFISHTITNFWGLLCVWFSIKWFQRSKKSCLALVFTTAVIAGVSDPWFLPAFALPIIISNLILWKIFHTTSVIELRKRCLILFALMSSASVVIASKLFGIFYFFTPMNYNFSFTNSGRSLKIFLKEVGFFINFFPFYTFWTSLLSLSILIGLIIYSGFLLKNKTKLNIDSIYFLLVSLFSLLGIFLSFLLIDHPKTLLFGPDDARYFLNFFTLGILSLSIATDYLWKYIDDNNKRFFSLAAMMYAVSGLLTLGALWKKPYEDPVIEKAHVIRFLNEQHLSYGYSDYWNASLLTALSQNSIQVRPVQFSPVTGEILGLRHWQNTYLWADSKIETSTYSKNFFVYLRKSGMDLSFRKSAIISQFGIPKEIFQFRQHLILVWKSPLGPCLTQYPLRADCKYLQYPF